MSRHDEAPSPGRKRQRQRTRTLLLASARTLLEGGKQPTVTEVADAAGVSRRTAYRYFPAQEKLLAEAALEGLRPLMSDALELPATGEHEKDAEARIDALVRNMMRLAFDNEALLRTMVHQTVLQGRDTETPRRGTRRVDWIETALTPLKARLSKEHYNRLVSALSVCTGIEAILVLRDIRGLSKSQTIQMIQWMAQVLVREALNSART